MLVLKVICNPILMHDDQVPTFARVLMYASELDLNIISRPLAEDISRPLAGGYLSHQVPSPSYPSSYSHVCEPSCALIRMGQICICTESYM